MAQSIHGYTYGNVAQSPVSIADLDLLKKTVLFDGRGASFLKK